MSQMIYNRSTNPCCNDKCDPCHDKESKPCKDLNTKVEFRYDERVPGVINPTPIPSTFVELLKVDFDKLAEGNRVWLSGVISINNDNLNSIASVVITILKYPPNITPTTIYTLFVEVDKDSGADLQAIPFSHVDVNTSNLFDVKYRVLVSANINGVSSIGPNTLTALRFEKK